MQNNIWFWLQLFADGAGGSGAAAGDGAGTASGENSADAGQQRLRELGVPEDKIRKNRAYRMTPKAEQKATAEVAGNQTEQAAAANEAPPTDGNAKAPRMTWDEIVADPEYNKQIQTLMQQRLRKTNTQVEAMDKLGPALEMLMNKHGIDPAKPDYEALSKAILDDDSLYEKQAMELNVDNDVAKRYTQMSMELQRRQRSEQQTLEMQRNQQHITRLEQQGQQLKAVFPGFDLRQELQNPAFARMTSPEIGLSVEDAYYAVHRKDIQAAQAQVIASQTAQQISSSIQANARRPDESGSSGQAPSVTQFNYKNATKAEREALKKRIRDAGARGEKVYPGR